MKKEERAFSWRGLLMLACCIVPIAIIAIILLGRGGFSGGAWLIFLLCPLMHLFMMRGMTHGHSHGVGSQKGDYHKDKAQY